MKIRRGFVSNSSTSSFMIYGTTIDPEEFVEKFKTSMTDEQLKSVIEKWIDKSERSKTRYKDRDWKEILNEGLGTDEEDYDSESMYFIEELMPYIDGLKDLSIHSGPYGEDLYIGISPECIGDDETGKEFKTRTENGIKSIMGKDMSCNYILEAWRDG